MSAIIVLVSVPSGDTALAIGRALVAERLAAAANVVNGMASVYRWQGAVEEGREALLMVKSTAARFEAVAARIKSLHPYQCPSIVALPIAAASAETLAWIAAETGDPMR
jgi:periplasmic divalent cation tolerance protein